jgi:hypothetical protein
LSSLILEPAFSADPRPWLVYCQIPYSLVGTDAEPKERAIYEYLSGRHMPGSRLTDSLSLEPARDGDLDLKHADRPLADVKIASVAETGSGEDRARALNAPFRPEVDFQRLVHPRDWARGLQEHPDAPWKVYDLKTLNDWRLAEAFVREDAGKMELGPELLKRIHHQTARHLFYPDYEARRVKLAYKKGNISYEDARQAILDLEKGKRFTNQPHSELAGKFRNQAPDYFTNFGDQWGEEGRYFTKAQIERYQQSPFFHVGYWTPVEVGPDRYRLAVHLPAPKDVEKLVGEAYDRGRRDLAAAKTDEQYVAAVLKLEQALVSIHPFLDGNGRSIRLQSDLLFRRRGIPPPLYPKDGDFTATPDELYQATIQGVRAYVREKIR